MKAYFFTMIVSFCLAGSLFAGQPEIIVTLETETGGLVGSLITPEGKEAVAVALIIPGSGPTDRDGNQPGLTSNCLKMLAHALSGNGIASLRYDKRGIGNSRKAGGNESDLRFEHYISDATGWIDQLKNDARFREIIVIGHSEGSLIGMVASQQGNVDQFISIAGPGLPADETLKKQLASQPPEVLKIALPMIETLKQGKIVDTVNPLFYSLFRPSVQPYMISWFRYDPAKEIARLKIPVLIVQGSTDIQVAIDDAHILAKANQKSEMKIIRGMNHVLKDAEPDRMKNIATYNNPELPVTPELLDLVIDFVNKDRNKHNPTQ